jgi:hypothetical protein
MRQVRGVLFLDYVKMLRAQKSSDVRPHLLPGDLAYLQAQIDPEAWYPMDVFERLGCAILATVTRGEVLPVRMWGRYSVQQLHRAYPTLLAPRDPVETVNRFRVLRETFFDFSALTVPLLHEDEAQITIQYLMGPVAEEAAANQTMGFFEGLLELAGARDVEAQFRERAWEGASTTRLQLRWRPPYA